MKVVRDGDNEIYQSSRPENDTGLEISSQPITETKPNQEEEPQPLSGMWYKYTLSWLKRCCIVG